MRWNTLRWRLFGVTHGIILFLLSVMWNTRLMRRFSYGLQDLLFSTDYYSTNNTKQWCHVPLEVSISNASHVGNLSNEILRQPSVLECGKLRRQWNNLSLLNDLSHRIQQHQTNCSRPAMTFQVDNNYGLGSHLYLWSQALCNAWEKGYRIQSENPEWLWLDQASCGDAQAASPFLCYFPQIEHQCPDDDNEINDKIPVPNPRDKRLRCSWVKPEDQLNSFRAASLAFAFQSVSPVVINEAKRQVALLFGAHGVPKGLITVHIRWGDKFWEMDLAPIDEYINAVKEMIVLQNRSDSSPAHVYLATEDPKAVAEFLAAAPSDWKVYTDRTVSELNVYRPPKGNRASWTTRNTKGRAGLVALGSLLVALEADYFVFTTGSNWSRLMDHLRQSVLDPRCHNCTRVIDLRPGQW